MPLSSILIMLVVLVICLGTGMIPPELLANIEHPQRFPEAGLFGSSKTYWEEWTFDFDIVDTLHDPSELRKRKKGLAQVLGTQMAKISSNCVDNMATVPSPDPKSLGSYVDRKSDVYWHEFSSESTAAKGGSSRTKGFFTGIFAPA